MTTDLETVLDLILNEKEQKLLPENIKKDRTVLGVTGALESGAMTEAEYDDCLDLTYMIISGEVPTKVDNGLLYSLETYETFNKKVVDTGIPQLSIQSAYTIFIKINPSSWGNYKGIIGYHGENKQGIVGFQYQDGSLVYANKPDSNVNVTMSPFSTNNDHLLIITYENNLLNIYDDDTKIISNASNVDISPYGNIFLGKAHDAENRFFDGKLGLCYIYNRVLSDDEISKMKIYINMKYSEVTK